MFRRVVVIASACAIALACVVLFRVIETPDEAGSDGPIAPPDPEHSNAATASAGSGSVDPTRSSEDAADCARLLATAGSSHLELMEAIRGSDPVVYERLVEAVPELRRQ